MAGWWARVPCVTDSTPTPASPAVDLYLDTMAKMLTRYGFEGRNVDRASSSPAPTRATCGTSSATPRATATSAWSRPASSTPPRREVGRDWPADAETMVGLKRLANVRECLESVLADGIEGDFIETGAWRGGTCIYARAILAAYGVTDRTVWVADSFEGLPAPDGRFEADLGDQHHTKIELAISVEQVEENFRRYDLLDDQVKFLKGWFSDTLPTAPIDKIAVLRLDGDMYASTMDALEPLYDKVPVGGYVIVDDYGAVKACAKAIHDFRDARGITDEIVEIDWAGIYWRKS